MWPLSPVAGPLHDFILSPSYSSRQHESSGVRYKS